MAAPDDIGDFLKKERLRRKWSQRRVATENRWDQAKVSRIETGKYPPSIDDMEAFARMYDVSLVKLVRMRARAA